MHEKKNKKYPLYYAYKSSFSFKQKGIILTVIDIFNAPGFDCYVT